MDATRPDEHTVSIVVNGREVLGPLDYQIDTSMIEPADSFTLRFPFSRDAWETCRRDARVRVLIDGLPRIDGFIDSRHKKSAKDGDVMEVNGRCRIGRLLDESAPRSAYGGQTMIDVLRALAAPWFDDVVLFNARNRRVQLGKGAKAPREDAAIALLKGKRPSANPDPIAAMFRKTRPTHINPGETRWQVIETICSKAGLVAFSSADGRELVVTRPDANQPETFTLRHKSAGYVSNVIELEYEESNAERYSMIMAVASGGAAGDYGDAACHRVGVVFDNEDDKAKRTIFGPRQLDGTGRDFQYPKRLVLGEQGAIDNAEASRIAALEQDKRDFHRTQVTATVHHHGQKSFGGVPALFAYDTIARVIDDDIDLDDLFLIYAVSFKGSREGSTSVLSMVPRGTAVVR